MGETQTFANKTRFLQVVSNRKGYYPSASAKYDANAESGIINIIHKEQTDGTNGALALGAGMGSRFRLNSSAILNHKSDKWNIGVGYDKPICRTYPNH
ncbi:MAG: hypothetical protein IPO04_16445 [Cytophagaceae bacterium]|nr:hypothetical protein [Cytophagaceae bacterium]